MLRVGSDDSLYGERSRLHVASAQADTEPRSTARAIPGLLLKLRPSVRVTRATRVRDGGPHPLKPLDAELSRPFGALGVSAVQSRGAINGLYWQGVARPAI